jgi:photosystem II stability/assembly factor-like uncharacterized protein
VVLKSGDNGQSWKEISGDLTRNEKSKQEDGGGPFTNEGAGGEVYNTLQYIAVSPHKSGVLWTGSDCGLVHITQDDGKNWQNLKKGNSFMNLQFRPQKTQTAQPFGLNPTIRFSTTTDLLLIIFKNNFGIMPT